MGLLLFGHVVLIPALFVLVWWDQHYHRLPDWLTLPGLGMSGLWVALLAIAETPEIAERSASALLGAVAALWLLAEAPGAPLGFGDVKLGAVLALHLGVHDPALVVAWLAVACVTGGAQAMWGLVTKRLSLRDHIAFGPHLILAWTVVLAVAGSATPAAT